MNGGKLAGGNPANGQTVDPKTGKPWATTMCNAWYIWEKDWKGEPTVRWLD